MLVLAMQFSKGQSDDLKSVPGALRYDRRSGARRGSHRSTSVRAPPSRSAARVPLPQNRAVKRQAISVVPVVPASSEPAAGDTGVEGDRNAN